jgi:hypothetical protein
MSLPCTGCGAALAAEAIAAARPVPCPGCGAPARVEVFPALFAPLGEGRAAEPLGADGEAGCFDHPGKKAVVPCDSCGRFLCSLCDLEYRGLHYCGRCLAAGGARGRLETLVTERMRYDRLALSLAALPPLTLIFFYFTVLTAPAALYVAIRRFRTPGSLVHRSRWVMMLAAFLATAQIAAWALLVAFLVRRSGGAA